MAAKDDTVAQWLNNKLGSATHLWSFSSTVISQYTLEKLHSIKDCFCTLDSLVKLKFFLSLFHIPKRCIEEFRPIVEEIIENTIQSCLDQWVLSTAMFVQTFWLTQSLDTQFEYDLDSLKESFTDLKKILKECVETESGCERSRFLLPIEFDYLNREARFNVLPNTSTFTNEFLFSLTAEDNYLFVKHFTLFKPPKAMTKLDELKNKASHYSKSKTTKSIIHTGLNSFAEYNDGISSSTYSSNRLMASKRNELGSGIDTNLFSSDPYSSKTVNTGSSSFFKRSMLTSTTNTTITGKSSTPKRNVGIKLLDVQEQFITPKEAKRKRKEQEKETLKKQKQEQTKCEKDEIEQLVAKQESLIRSDEHTGLGMPKVTYAGDEETYFNKHHHPESEHANKNGNEMQQIHPDLVAPASVDFLKQNNNNQEKNNFSVNSTHQKNTHGSSHQQGVPSISDQFQNQTNQNHHNSARGINNNPPLPNFITNHQFDRPHQEPLHQVATNEQLATSSFKLEAFSTQSSLNSIVPPTFTKPSALSFMQQSSAIENEANIDSQRSAQQPFQGQHSSQSQAHQQSLSLTREQMLQAQEMFSNSNLLSRPDKAQILGFIAGSRDNPCPDQGSLVAIKLNEAEEIISAANGEQHKVLGEMYFEMNYDTGDYKKVKKFKNLLDR